MGISRSWIVYRCPKLSDSPPRMGPGLRPLPLGRAGRAAPSSCKKVNSNRADGLAGRKPTHANLVELKSKYILNPPANDVWNSDWIPQNLGCLLQNIDNTKIHKFCPTIPPLSTHHPHQPSQLSSQASEPSLSEELSPKARGLLKMQPEIPVIGELSHGQPTAESHQFYIVLPCKFT